MLPRAVTSTQPMPAKASSPTHPPLLLAGSKVLNGTGSADQVATRWACWGSAVSHACSPAGLAAVTCLWSGWCPTMLPRAVIRQPNQCLPKLPAPHPSTFAFSGFEGAKRHRLCRPSGNPLGLNPAGVLLFCMRAHRRGWRL